MRHEGAWEYLMQEHPWKSHGAGPISVWEPIWNLNVGSYSRYFEIDLNSALKKYLRHA